MRIENDTTFPIRVLCVFSTLDRGGAETMCMNLYRCIDRTKVQFDFIKHTSEKGEYEDEISSLGGKIFVAPRFRMYNLLTYLKWWREFLNTHREYQIIHGHYYTISAVYFACCKKAGRITVGHSHSTVLPIESRRNLVVRFISERLIASVEKFSDYCLACSRVAGEWLYKKKPFSVLPNAIYTEQFAFNQITREEYRYKLGMKDELVLGTVANFSSAKNPIGLINIFKEISIQNNQTKLLWVGDGPLRSTIEEKLKVEGIVDRVILTGLRNDVPALLQAMDVFLLPSFHEGLPVVLIEAQSAGLPCYVSDSVTREVDIAGLCQFLPLEKTDEWARLALDNHIERMDTTNKIYDAGYDIHTTAKWLQEFYITILNEKLMQ